MNTTTLIKDQDRVPPCGGTTGFFIYGVEVILMLALISWLIGRKR